jgi:hypothetical protein
MWRIGSHVLLSEGGWACGYAPPHLSQARMTALASACGTSGGITSVLSLSMMAELLASKEWCALDAACIAARQKHFCSVHR